jgi:DNA-binding beta-propeller fold protein YncE
VLQTDRVFVSDSGNHRIVVLEKDGRFVTSVGSPVGESGFADGDFDSARFTSPQGLAVLDGVRSVHTSVPIVRLRRSLKYYVRTILSD